MEIGLVLGKFNPLHLGHIALIEFAQEKCNELIVLICASDKETTNGSTRLNWVKNCFKGNPKIRPILLNYLEAEFPNTSVSSKEVSTIWASKLKTLFPQIDIIFSSEIYGNYLAEILKCRHICFDIERKSFNISASEINSNIYKYWNFLPTPVRPYYVKKICLYGTESTGKSTITEKLANYFQTTFVPEMAREIIEATEECTENHLIQIAELQAKTINEKIKTANKLLFIDTDLNITSSYSQFLFNKKLVVDNWVDEANNFDLYLYLDNDAPFIQDGTRLDKERRDELNISHKKQLIGKGIKYQLVTGNWDERFEKSVEIVKRLLVDEESQHAT
ncbi:MAG: AAA family ATPase [Flavihumibacter sp.]|nr:AAA family ATPase [Flavihumibacter sp.]